MTRTVTTPFNTEDYLHTEGVRAFYEQQLKRDEVAAAYRRARRTPYGRKLARMWFLAKRKTERELADNPLCLFPATSGGLSAIVRGEVK